MKRGLLSVCFLLVFLASSASSAPNLVDIAETATLEQIRQAVQAGADVNAVDSAGRSVLMLAAASNPDPAVISALVKAGAKVNFRGPARGRRS
jgi:ankyrin repeat protein